MVEELKSAQLGVKLEECWCGVLMYEDNIVLVRIRGRGAGWSCWLLEVVCGEVENEVQQYEEEDYGEGRWNELENWWGDNGRGRRI